MKHFSFLSRNCSIGMNHAALAVLLAVYGTVATESPSCVVVHDAPNAQDPRHTILVVARFY